MTTTTTATTYTHRPRVTCQLCGDTGVVAEEGRAPIGRASNGETVSSRIPRTYRFACPCRAGWGRSGA